MPVQLYTYQMQINYEMQINYCVEGERIPIVSVPLDFPRVSIRYHMISAFGHHLVLVQVTSIGLLKGSQAPLDGVYT